MAPSKSFRCWGTSHSTGERCAIRTARRFPYCWVHLRKYYKLTVKPSTVDGWGMGLFYVGKVPKRKGDFVAHYSGPEYMTDAQLDERYNGSDSLARYAFCATLNQCTDAVDEAKSDVGRYINDYRNSGRPKNVRFSSANFRNLSRRKELGLARTVPTSYGVSILATRTINPGDELFLSYGPAYHFASS